MLSENLLCICFNTETQRHRVCRFSVSLRLCVYKKRWLLPYMHYGFNNYDDRMKKSIQNQSKTRKDLILRNLEAYSAKC
ncbi:hypothetical protein EZS27_019051 [termite gut metagenome]|uniref:Uncharacterized protein n=1 Tax=termite gut metagenome TaxID=433724 RepID=A0A5J4REB9_9ZZZZ